MGSLRRPKLKLVQTGIHKKYAIITAEEQAGFNGALYAVPGRGKDIILKLGRVRNGDFGYSYG